ncbi:hypothetical protein [Streptomyces sp. L2]|uniref:hypothetical protein n=1 Tax=Streptomyces sp. L2 TaxID=2162665 RepID=UPI0010113C30|nr:hypothetical protein [Streptomyces sp. L2]
MSKQPAGPACGNNPNYRMSDGDRQVVEDFKAYLVTRAALRDRIAETLYAFDHPSRIVPLRETGMEPAYQETAAAVLAVLPAPDQQAAEVTRLRSELAKALERNAADRCADYAAGLRKAADFVGNDDDCGCGGCDSCVPNKLAAELRRMADEAQPAETATTGLATLAAALDGLHTLIATSSRDWGAYRVDAWIWAVICGWDCEKTEHDDSCTHGALEEMAGMHGWDEATVAKARRYRAAVRALVEAQQDGARP